MEKVLNQIKSLRTHPNTIRLHDPSIAQTLAAAHPVDSRCRWVRACQSRSSTGNSSSCSTENPRVDIVPVAVTTSALYWAQCRAAVPIGHRPWSKSNVSFANAVSANHSGASHCHFWPRHYRPLHLDDFESPQRNSMCSVWMLCVLTHPLRLYLIWKSIVCSHAIWVRFGTMPYSLSRQQWASYTTACTIA